MRSPLHRFMATLGLSLDRRMQSSRGRTGKIYGFQTNPPSVLMMVDDSPGTTSIPVDRVFACKPKFEVSK